MTCSPKCDRPMVESDVKGLDDNGRYVMGCLRDLLASIRNQTDSFSANGSSLLGRTGVLNFGSTVSPCRYLRIVLRDNPVGLYGLAGPCHPVACDARAYIEGALPVENGQVLPIDMRVTLTPATRPHCST